MQTTLELTLYPLQDEYLPLIKNFIAHLQSYSGVTLQTFPTATIVQGEHDAVMDLLRESTRWQFEHQGKAVFVAKILPNYEALAS